MLSCSTRLVSLSTPFRATRATLHCSRRGTTPRSPPSTGTVPVHAWFFVGRRSSVKSGCRVLGPTQSRCSCSFCTFATEIGIRIRSRMFVHGDSQFTWIQQSDRGYVSLLLLPTITAPLRRLIKSSQLIPANRPGLAVAKWRTDSRNDGHLLQIFQEAFVEPGLLEAILLSLILLQSGLPFGDTLPPTCYLGPMAPPVPCSSGWRGERPVTDIGPNPEPEPRFIFFLVPKWLKRLTER
jgi:hypothetical protein